MRSAIIIGAGPAGLTAAYELLDKTDIRPIILERDGDTGGLSKTVVYQGNRMDVGGHRFFSKSDRVMDWWTNILPLQGAPARDYKLLNIAVETSKESRIRPLGESSYLTLPSPDPDATDRVMLLRRRVSRIYYRNRFFDYPISLSPALVFNLGPVSVARIGASYAFARLFRIREEKSLEDLLINRFGRELYQTFFRDYTEKVWGIPTSQIQPEWGAQRIKGLNISKTLRAALRSTFSKSSSLSQKRVETSLIERFFYPKLGPGQLWQEVADQIQQRGGEVRLHHVVIGVKRRGNRIDSVLVRDEKAGSTYSLSGDHFISSMPIRELVMTMTDPAPDGVREVAQALEYRDFVTVGLLFKRLLVVNRTKYPTINDIIPDNWIYVQEKYVQVGRIQIFNNWSPYMVRDPASVWLGMEYFCNEGDGLWSQTDAQMIDTSVDELGKMGLASREDLVDGVVVRVKKAYPAYFGSYGSFGVIREFVDQIENLYLVGRNGMHRYNNADHSMMTAMVAVENIQNQPLRRDNIWSVNTEQEYNEENR